MRKRIYSFLLASIMLGCSILAACQNTGTIDAPQGLAYDNQTKTISWQAVEGAQSYTSAVYRKGTNILAIPRTTALETKLVVSTLGAGDYTVKVCAIATETEKESFAAALDFSVPIEIVALATPQNLKYEDGKLSWDEVDGATEGYSVLVYDKDYTEDVYINTDVSVAEIDVSSLEVGAYSLDVRAKAVEGLKTASNIATISFTVVAVVPALDPVSEILFSSANRIMSFRGDSRASGFRVVFYIHLTNDYLGEVSLPSNATYCAFPQAVLEKMPFNELVRVEITSVGKAGVFEDSEVVFITVSIEAQTLATPKGISFNAQTDLISFNSVYAADCYKYTIYSKQDDQAVLFGEAFDPQISVRALAFGEYTLVIQAAASQFDTRYCDSQSASFDFTIESLGQIPVPTNLQIVDGYATFSCQGSVEFEAIVEELGTQTPLSLEGKKVENKKFPITFLELNDGFYRIKIRSVSPRYAPTASDYISTVFRIEKLVYYTAQQIANDFTGELTSPATGGEHAQVEYIMGNAAGRYAGNMVAQISPTKDGWGELASPMLSINFDKNPILVYKINYLNGGHHVSFYDTAKRTMIADTTSNEDVIRNMKYYGTSSTATGTKTAALLLGVNSPSPATVQAYSAKIVFATQYPDIPDEPQQIAAPDNFSVRNGVISWQNTTYNNGYEYEIVGGSNTTIVDGTNEQDDNSLSLTDLAEGDYTLKLKSIANPIFNGVDSDQTTIDFCISSVQEWNAQEIASTWTPADWDGGNVTYDNDKDEAILNYNGAREYGAVGNSVRIDLDFDKNPFVRVELAWVKTGYLARAIYSGQSIYVISNDVKGDKESTTLLFDLRYTAAGGLIGGGTGIKSNFKFFVGFCGGIDARVAIKNVKISYIELL